MRHASIHSSSLYLMAGMYLAKVHLGLGSEHARTQCLLVSAGFFGMSCVLPGFHGVQ